MKKLLHIAAHMGGGAGKAISGIIKNLPQYDNTLLLLESPVEMIYINECLEKKISLVVSSDTKQILKLALESDAVVFDWWFHPLSVNVLNALDNIDVRLLLWSHINGIFYPYLPYKFINLFDGCMFTSPCVFENDYWKEEEKNKIKSLSEIVYGMGEFKAENNTAKEDYDIKDYLKIGYSGTLNFSKMNEKFPEICEIVHKKIPDVIFEFYGKCEEGFKKLFNDKYVEFKGYSNKLEEILPDMDIYCYLLNAENFATTENALLEAMAVGLPVIVLNNPAERCIVSNNETGLIAENKEQIIMHIQTLYSDKELRKRLGSNARKLIIKNIPLKKI